MGVEVLIAEGVDHNILSFNELYAKQREWQISCGENRFSFGTSAPSAIAGEECTTITVSVGIDDIGLSFYKLPSMHMLSNSFSKEIDLDSLSPEIQLMVIEAAAGDILTRAETFFRHNISISKVAKSTRSGGGQDEICMYLKTQDGSFATNFYISGTPGIMNFIRKSIIKTTPKRIHKFNSIAIEYSIELGRTYLTNDEYLSIGKNDIIFIKNSHLGSGQPVPLRGLGISAVITDGKVIASTKPIP
ncbi:MAG: hypothetical protein LBB20_02385 [Puniceicoccales bacterium]|jgi:hypothetical protein|nr:hypothetical protein [Puniceicoccales bacterium]